MFAKRSLPRYTPTLLAILLLATFLRFFRLSQEGFANLYYAAGVKSMMMSWHNFFFASFDPAGFVSIDKPPLGLWIQAASAALFGFHGWALLFPQAIAGVLSVVLTYRLARHAFGPTAGLFAALTLAVTPISVAANRNNTQDSLLVCLLLLATWALFRATERGKLRWLLLAFALVGLGFNIKMLQAYMVLPAFGLLYLFGTPLDWGRRILHLILATLLLLVISLAWAVAVDMTPADLRPYVGSSATNSVLELMTGHNGLARLLPGRRNAGPAQATRSGGALLPVTPQPAQGRPQGGPPGTPPQGNLPQNGPPQGAPQPGGAFSHETGNPGPFRLFNRQLAGQVLWLLPLAAIGAAAILWRGKLRLPLSPLRHIVLFWIVWLLPQMAFFSVANIFHRYYLEMLAPALAVLTGAGMAMLRYDYTDRTARAWLLPVALLATAAMELFILWPFPDYRAWLAPVLVVGEVAAVGTLLNRLGKFFPFESVRSVERNAMVVGLLSLLIAPAVWAWIPVWRGGDGWLPFAGPDVLVEQRVSPTEAGSARLATFLQAQRRNETFLLATLDARDAAPLILETGAPVMAMGGFSGSDPILTPSTLEELVNAGEVRFFLLSNVNQNNSVFHNPLTRWVTQRCRVIPPARWGGLRSEQGMQLWDCEALNRW